jgi:GMP synthase (glutamine-hydrolysing)
MAHPGRKVYGPAVPPRGDHTPRGKDMLRHFVLTCAAARRLDPGHFVEEQIAGSARGGRRPRDLRPVRRGRLVGGGGPAARAIGPQLHCVFVDNGVLRHGEAEEVERFPGSSDLHVADAADRCSWGAEAASPTRSEAQDHRRTFIEVFEDEARPSGRTGVPGPGHALPRRHRERVPVRAPGHHQEPPQRRRAAGRPEVRARRAAARAVQGRGARGGPPRWACPRARVWRQPFPGPGLAVRILGEVTPERVAVLRSRPTPSCRRRSAAGLERAIWQASRCCCRCAAWA